jgi:hypothetical protein
MMRSRLYKFFKLPAADRQLLASAIIAIVRARVAVTFVPVREILQPLAPRTDPAFPDTDTAKVGWAVETAGRFVPTGKNCLVKAIAGREMLARQGISSQLRIGIAKDSPDILLGHAWLECGDQIITGEGEHRNYAAMPVGDLYDENGPRRDG